MSAQRSTRPVKGCGTHAAWARHKARGEKVDDACRAARRAYNTAWMARSRAEYPVGICAGCERERPIQRRGWCESCVTRWQQVGRPASGPPPLLDAESLRTIRGRVADTRRMTEELNRAIRAGGWACAA